MTALITLNPVDASAPPSPDEALTPDEDFALRAIAARRNPTGDFMYERDEEHFRLFEERRLGNIKTWIIHPIYIHTHSAYLKSPLPERVGNLYLGVGRSRTNVFVRVLGQERRMAIDPSISIETSEALLNKVMRGDYESKKLIALTLRPEELSALHFDGIYYTVVFLKMTTHVCARFMWSDGELILVDTYFLAY